MEIITAAIAILGIVTVVLLAVGSTLVGFWS